MSNETPSFKEDHISQIPALKLLINMGFEYLSPEETLKQRDDRLSNVILEDILREQLTKINWIEYRGTQYSFSNTNINAAVEALRNVPYDGLMRTNEKVYDLLSLGKSFQETIADNTKSYTLKYIDWDHPDNNVYHVTDEFNVEASDGKTTTRPDIVLFVNGIPFVVIECKRPDERDSLDHAINQQLRNQNKGNKHYIPKLFQYIQILIAINKNEAKFGTIRTPIEKWTTWVEKDPGYEHAIERLVNTCLDDKVKDELFNDRFKYVSEYFDEIESEGRQVTEQDRGLYFLCNKKRLLELAHKFIVYDMGIKKIARYQQYFAINKTLERIKQFTPDKKKRKGGVIWHSQGAGKSLQMVILAKVLALDPEINNPRIIIVSDRINLDRQIWKTFKHCKKKVKKAKSGEDLKDKLTDTKYDIITTVLHKFERALSRGEKKIFDSENIFVLVDESHRSQYGLLNSRMQKMLPNACYIGYTGTPILKKDKNTLQRFGGFIHTYTMDEAVEDDVIVPLLYEGRHVEQEVNKQALDTWFERETRNLSKEQKADLKKKYSSLSTLSKIDQRLMMIAFDISIHYSKNWKNTQFKAMLATSSRESAVKYKKLFDELGEISSEVIISGPDQREETDDEDVPTEVVHKFWNNMMERFGDEEKYNKDIIDAFNEDEEPELLIVVSKLLTGFDSPRATILYIDKKLEEHNLLQAIARVNRVHKGKDSGFIIDYRGILGNLDRALSTYRALEGFEEEDLENIESVFNNIIEEIKKLPQKHSELWDIFKEVVNKKDEEEYELLLFDKAIRVRFYDKLSEYSRVFGIAIGSTQSYDILGEEKIKRYKDDLKFFQNLRASIKQRYAEEIDYQEYEPKIRRLLNTYVSSTNIIQIIDQVNIFNKEEFQAEIDKIKGTAGKADAIAHRTMRAIEEKMEEDPVFYQKYSTIIIQTINDYHHQRMKEKEYLDQVLRLQETVRERKDKETPSKLNGYEEAKAFYGIVNQTIVKKKGMSQETRKLSADVGLGLDKIIRDNIIVDWQRKTNIQNKMINEIEDYLYDHEDLELEYEEIDEIIEAIMKVARKRYAQ